MKMFKESWNIFEKPIISENLLRSETEIREAAFFKISIVKPIKMMIKSYIGTFIFFKST